MLRRKLACLCALLVITTACAGTEGGGAAAGGAAEDYPSETLQWTIAFGPGGGNDIMSRTIIEILEAEELYPADIVAENREGGSGAKGWGYFAQQEGDPYHISSTSGSFITTPLQADTGWAPGDFTPIGLLASDRLLFMVNADSPHASFEDFIAAAEQDAPSIGGIGTVNVDFIVNSLLAEEAGYKFDYVPFNDEGELQSALLSGSLDAAVSNPAEVLGLIESGDVKPLLFTGTERLEALPDVPTIFEAGFDIDISMPRGLILPPDAPEQAQQWWIDTMEQVVQTDEWAQYVEENALEEQILWGEDFTEYLRETQDTFEKILREQGAID